MGNKLPIQTIAGMVLNAVAQSIRNFDNPTDYIPVKVIDIDYLFNKITIEAESCDGSTDKMILRLYYDV